MNCKTVKEFLIYGKKFLKENNLESYSIDAEVLLMYVLNFTKIQLFTKDNYILSEIEKEKYINVLNDRKNFMPVQYITGKCEFMGLEFNVNESTLIPRGDTEILVEKAIKTINENNYKTVLDIGTGSGAIAVSVAHFCKNTSVSAVDISKKALDVAKKNAEKNNVSVDFIYSDLFENINSKFDIILSNPPYIETNIIDTLMPQVKNYEPFSALDGGEDGLDFYRKIISDCKKYLNENGSIIFEIGYNQAKEITEILKAENFKEIQILKDLAGLDRVVACIYK